jgi:hypothetical protein
MGSRPKQTLDAKRGTARRRRRRATMRGPDTEAEWIHIGQQSNPVRSVFRNGFDKLVVALDIDGTLGDYHGHFLDFAKKYFNEDMPDPKEINPGKHLWEHMGVERHEYREAKLAYRQGGWKRWMPVYDGASELTQSIRNLGAEVWITTTRPYLRLDNIDPDTREWLRRNSIEYDAVLFGDRKYTELVRQVGASRVIAVVDDLPECLSEAAGNGIRNLWLRDQPYNQHFKPRWADRVDDLWDLQGYILTAIEMGMGYSNGQL